MARDTFAAALAAVLKHEGGWSDHPSDPGGATMRGITLATYRQYRPGATKQDLRNITDAELQRIYRDGYWNVIRGDDLPAGLDLAVFDFAVNSGPARAAIYLQNIVGAAPDGKIGPLTLAAVAKLNPVTLISDLCSHRLAFLERLSTWPVFGKGWTKRVNDVRILATQMAQGKAATPPNASPAPSVPKAPQAPAVGALWPILIIAITVLVAVLFITR